MFRSASRVIAAVLGSTALAAAAVLPAAAAGHPHDPRPQRSSVVLGAIQYDSPGRDDGSRRSLNAEWVTVRNTGRHAVNLRGWTLSEGRHQVYRFGHLVLRGHQSVRVHTGHGRDTHRDVYQDRRNVRVGQPLRHRGAAQRPPPRRGHRELGPPPRWRAGRARSRPLIDEGRQLIPAAPEA